MVREHENRALAAGPVVSFSRGLKCRAVGATQPPCSEQADVALTLLTGWRHRQIVRLFRFLHLARYFYERQPPPPPRVNALSHESPACYDSAAQVMVAATASVLIPVFCSAQHLNPTSDHIHLLDV